MKIVVNTDNPIIKAEAQRLAERAAELAFYGNEYFTLNFNSDLPKYELWNKLEEITEGTLKIQNRGLGDNYFKVMVVERW